MTVKINGQTYYRTAEICARAGISRATLFRWLKAGILKKTYRDRRGWRMFTDNDLDFMRAEADMIKVDYTVERRAKGREQKSKKLNEQSPN
jgi:DNA-binding transcriptional MerR regulator